MGHHLRQTVTLRNSKAGPLLVRIEPWANEVIVQPGDALLLHFEGPSGEAIEVEAEEHALVVYGWVGSTVDVKPPAK